MRIVGTNITSFPNIKGQPIWRLKYLKTFDARKLSASIQSILDATVLDLGKQSAINTKENLKKMRSPKLADFTKEMRKKNIGWGGKKVKTNVGGTQPLYQTGHLRRNIKWNSAQKTLDMPAYGKIQNSGFTSQIKTRYMNIRYINVPPRPFIALPKNFIFSEHGGNYLSVAKPMKAKYLKVIRKRLKKRLTKAFQSGQKSYSPILRYGKRVVSKSSNLNELV